MKISEIMTRSPLTVEASTPLKSAATSMVAARVSGLPVVDSSGDVIGIITEADFMHHVPGPVRKPRAGLVRSLFSSETRIQEATTVGDIMTTEVISVSPTDDTAVAVRLMDRHRIKRLPVLESGVLVGIVSRADLLEVLVRPDAVIAAEVREKVVHDLLMLEIDQVRVDVSDGIVTLGGTVPNRTDARILEEVTAHLAGVVAVRCNVDYEFDDYASSDEPRHVTAPRPDW